MVTFHSYVSLPEGTLRHEITMKSPSNPIKTIRNQHQIPWNHHEITIKSHKNHMKPASNPMKSPLNHHQIPLNHMKPASNPMKSPSNPIKPHETSIKSHEITMKSPLNPIKPHETSIKSHEITMKSPLNPIKPHETSIKSPWKSPLNHHEIPMETPIFPTQQCLQELPKDDCISTHFFQTLSACERRRGPPVPGRDGGWGCQQRKRKMWDINWIGYGCVWKCCVPLNPMVMLIIIPIKWLFHWEYTLFSDKPIYGCIGYLWIYDIWDNSIARLDDQRLSGWWFGTWILFSQTRLGMMIQSDFHIVSGGLKPPTTAV